MKEQKINRKIKSEKRAPTELNIQHATIRLRSETERLKMLDHEVNEHTAQAGKKNATTVRPTAPPRHTWAGTSRQNLSTRTTERVMQKRLCLVPLQTEK